MGTFFTYSDDDQDQLRVSVHVDGFYFTISDEDVHRTVVVSGERAVELARQILGEHPIETLTEPEPEPEPDTVLTTEQQQRRDGLIVARSALESAGGMFSKGSKIEPQIAALLVSVAGFITTGQRDYLTDQLVDRDRPTAREFYLDQVNPVQ